MAHHYSIADGYSSNKLAAVLDTVPSGNEYGLAVRLIGGATIQGGGTSSLFANVFPPSGTAIGFSDGTNMQGSRVYNTNTGGQEWTLGVNLRGAGPGGSIEIGTQANPIFTKGFIAQYNSSPPSLSDGTLSFLQVDSSGNLKTTASFTASYASAPGTLVPNSAVWLGASDGTNLRGLLVESPSIANLRTSIFYNTTEMKIYTDGYTGVHQIDASWNVAATQGGTWTVQPGNTANTTPWLMTISQSGNSAAVTGSNALKVDGSAVTQPISGTITANAGSGTFAVSGTVAATQSGAWTVIANAGSGTFTVGGTVTANIGTSGALALDATLTKLTIAQGTSLGANTQVLIGGSVTTVSPSYTTGQISPLSLDTTGALRVNVTAGGSSGSVADKTSFTYGTTSDLVVAGVYQDASPTLSAGTSGALRLTTNRGLHVNLRDSSGNEKIGSSTSANSIPVVIASDQSSYTVATTQSGAWTVQPGNTANTTPWLTTINQGGNSAAVTASNALKVDGSAVTQPISGSITTIPGIIDPNNSTTGTLLSNGIYTGVGTDVLGFANIEVLIASDKNSASSGVSIQFSNDNSNWDDSSTFTYISGAAPNLGQVYVVGARARYFRVVYTNTNAAQTYFRLQTVLKTVNITGDILSAASIPSDVNHALLTKSVITGHTTGGGGGGYVDVKVSPSGAVQVGGTIDTITSITNPIAVTQSGAWNIGTVTSITNTVSIADANLELTQGSATSGQKGPLIQGAVTTSAPSYSNLQTSPLSLTTTGALRVDSSAVTQPISGTVTANAGSGTFAINGTVTANQGGTWTVQPGNTVNTTPWLTTISQGGNSAAVTGSNALRVDGSAVTQPISGTITANAGSGTFAVSGTVTANAGNGNFNIIGTGTDNTTNVTTKLPVIAARANTSAPTWTDGYMVPLSATTAGALRVDGSSVTQPISGTITANIGSTNGLALDATLTGGTAKTIIRAGQKGATNTNADITHTAEGTDHEALDVQLYHGGSAINPQTIRTLTNTDTVSAEITKWIGSTAPTVGSKTSVNSIPVVVASDQSAIAVSQSGTWNIGTLTSITNPLPSGSNTIGAVGQAGLWTIQPLTNSSIVKAQLQDNSGNALSATGSSLNVNITGGSSSGSVADKTTFTYGTTNELVIGGVYQDTSPTLASGTSGAMRLTTNRGLHVNLRDSSGNEKLGQLTMANSIPVAIASDQTAVPASQSGTWNIGTVTTLTGITNTVNVADANLALSQGSTTSGQKGPLIQGAVSTSAPSYSNAQTSPLSLTTAGALRVDGSAVNQPTRIVDSTGSQTSTVFPAGFLRVTEEPTQVFYDAFDGVSLDLTNRWNAICSGGVPAAIASGSLTLGSGTTAGSFSYLQSQMSFTLPIPGWLGFSSVIQLEFPVTTNAYRFWGSGTISGAPAIGAAMIDAVGFEIDTTGKMYAVVYSAGTKVFSQDLSASGTNKQPTDANQHRYIVYVRTDKMFFYIDGIDGNSLVATTNFNSPSTQGLPATLITIAGPTPPISSAVITCGGTAVWDTGRNNTSLSDGTFPWRKASVDLTGALKTTSASIVTDVNGTYQKVFDNAVSDQLDEVTMLLKQVVGLLKVFVLGSTTDRLSNLDDLLTLYQN